MKIFELLIDKWPEFAFMVILFFGVIIAFRLIIKNVLSEYRELLNQYKNSNEFMIKEIEALQKSNEKLKGVYNSLEQQVNTMRNELDLTKSEIEKWENTWENAKIHLIDKIKEVEDIRLRTITLFSDRDKILQDLEIVWDVLLRVGVYDPYIRKTVEKAKEKKVGSS